MNKRDVKAILDMPSTIVAGVVATGMLLCAEFDEFNRGFLTALAIVGLAGIPSWVWKLYKTRER